MNPSPNSLVEAARSRFETLTPAEARILDCLPCGELADLSAAEAEDALAWEEWADSPGRTVRAEFVRWLCVTPALHDTIDPKGIRVRGALVPQCLDLDSVVAPFGLRLIDCALPLGADLSNARFPRIDLSGCFLQYLRADFLEVRGPLVMWPGVRCAEGIVLESARIGGDLLIGGQLQGIGRPAVQASGVRVEGTLAFDAGTRCTGAVALEGCEVRGVVDLSGLTIRAREDVALVLDMAKCGRALLLGQGIGPGIRTIGPVSLVGASIEGDLVLTGAQVRGRASRPEWPVLETDGVAIRGTQARIGGNIRMGEGSIAHGTLGFASAQVRGDIDLRGARTCALRGPVAPAWDRTAVQLWAAHVEGVVVMAEGFHADGNVVCATARVDGSFSVECGTDDRGRTSPHVLFLANAEIGGTLELRRRPDAVDGEPWLGGISMSHARIGTLTDSQEFWRAVRPGTLWIEGIEIRKLGRGAPTSAHVRNRDFLAKQWKDPSRPESFQPGPFRVLASVLREGGHEGDAERVLIAMERTRRRASGIRRLTRHPRPPRGVSWGWVRSRVGSVGWGVWDNVLDVTIRYGYRSTQALAWMLAVWLACTLVFSFAYEERVMVPSAAGQSAIRDPIQARAAERWRGGYAVPTHYPTFHPALYSLDVLLPVVDLHQESEWLPLEPARVRELIESGRGNELGQPAIASSGGDLKFEPGLSLTGAAEAAARGPDSTAVGRAAMRATGRLRDIERLSALASVALPVESLLGWFLTTMFLAGLSGLLDRK